MAASLLAGFAAVGQELGLDLTSDAPDLRPVIAVIGVSAAPEQHKPSLATSELLVKLLRNSNAFAQVLTPKEVQPILGEGYADALTCADAECLGALAAQLGVDRLLRADLTGSSLSLTGFDWGEGKLEQLSFDLSALGRRRPVDEQMAQALAPLFHELGALRGTLQVHSNLQEAQVEWGGRQVGTGTQVQSVLSAGTHPLRVSAPDFMSVERQVTVTSAQTTREVVNLEHLPPSVPAVPQVVETEFDKPAPPPGPALWSRPGSWVALAGVAALGVGIGFGSSANGVSGRMVDANHDGALDVTRAEFQTAQRDALLANVLGGAGAALIVGGTVWMTLGGVSVHGSF